MQTECASCVPTKSEIESLYDGNYKIKVDGKILSQKDAIKFAKTLT